MDNILRCCLVRPSYPCDTKQLLLESLEGNGCGLEGVVAVQRSGLPDNGLGEAFNVALQRPGDDDDPARWCFNG